MAFGNTSFFLANIPQNHLSGETVRLKMYTHQKSLANSLIELLQLN